MNFKYLIGMPHLGFNGLSENWLLKECGNIHWKMLSERMGILSENLIDKQGNRIYSSFVTYTFDGNLSNIYEGFQLEIDSDLYKITEKKLISIHKSKYFTLKLISIFLKRGKSNTDFTSLTPIINTDNINFFIDDKSIIQQDKIIRKDNMSFLNSTNIFNYIPVPEIDFNGAKFLYFASYQKIMEMAEWNILQPIIKNLENFTIKERKIFYFSNIDVNQSLAVKIILNQYENNIDYNAEIININMNKKMAIIYTTKEL